MENFLVRKHSSMCAVLGSLQYRLWGLPGKLRSKISYWSFIREWFLQRMCSLSSYSVFRHRLLRYTRKWKSQTKWLLLSLRSSLTCHNPTRLFQYFLEDLASNYGWHSNLFAKYLLLLTCGGNGWISEFLDHWSSRWFLCAIATINRGCLIQDLSLTEFFNWLVNDKNLRTMQVTHFMTKQSSGRLRYGLVCPYRLPFGICYLILVC